MNLPQVLNALSMVSPFLVWLQRRRGYKHLFFHKLLILHIPISFMYHFLQGIKDMLSISQKYIIIFKVADCVLVHGYAITCNKCIATKKQMIFSQWETIIRGGAYMLNGSCIVNIVHEPKLLDDVAFSMIRVMAIGVLSCSSFRHTKKRISGSGYGALCALLFIADSYMLNYGHCLFHLLLGGLHNTIYDCVEERKETQLPISPMVGI